MLNKSTRQSLLEAARVWAEAESYAALQLEYGYGKEVFKAEESAKKARRDFEDLLNQA